MDIIIKHFNDLSARELFEIYKLRVSVFVVEQKCPYQEVDDADKEAYHVMLRDEGGIQAYARVLPPGAYFEDAAIGRVIAVKPPLRPRQPRCFSRDRCRTREVFRAAHQS